MESSKKYRNMARYIKLNVYLLLLVALYYFCDELWALNESLTGQSHRFVFFRTLPSVRVIAAGLWGMSIVLALEGLRSENCSFLQPAKYLVLLEVSTSVAEKVIRAMDEEMPDYRIYVLFTFTQTVFALFVVLTVSALKDIFDGRDQLQQETMINMNLNSTTIDAVDTTNNDQLT